MSTTQNDLKIYYSGGLQSGELQNSSLLSLGGFRSSVIVPNSRNSNIFDDVGFYEATQEQEITRCLFVRNEHLTDAMVNLSLWIEGKKDFEEISFGVSIPNSDDLVQMLDSQFDLPYNVEFVEAYTEPNKVILITSLAGTKSIALWIKRKIIKPETIASDNSELQFHFDWT